MIRSLTIGLAGWLISCLGSGLCQTAPDTISGIYASFFLTVAQAANGSRTQRGIEAAIGLTDGEMRSLDAVAADYQARSRALNPGRVIFEARLRSLESGEDSSEWLAQWLCELDNQGRQLVLDLIQQLKTALGDSRFSVLDTYVHAWHGAILASPSDRAKK